MYIIQTNTSYDDKDKPVDFQSLMYKINKQNWNEFKEYILSTENYTEKIVQGTMIGCTKPRFAICKELINDDFHLEVVMIKYDNTRVNAKYYMVTDEQFGMLL